MNIVSKFLTAEARITSVTYRNGSIVVEALVKEFMPMTVEMTRADLKVATKMLAEPVFSRIEPRLPRFVSSALRRRLRPEPTQQPSTV